MQIYTYCRVMTKQPYAYGWCGMLQIREWLDQAEQRMSSLQAAMIGKEQEGLQRAAAFRAELEARLGKELDRIELNLNANLGESVSACLEQLSASATATREHSTYLWTVALQILLCNMAHGCSLKVAREC